MAGFILGIVILGGFPAIMVIGCKAASRFKPKDGRPSSYLQMTLVTLTSCGAGAWLAFWIWYMNW
jgi:hypothetical protein